MLSCSPYVSFFVFLCLRDIFGFRENLAKLTDDVLKLNINFYVLKSRLLNDQKCNILDRYLANGLEDHNKIIMCRPNTIFS